MGGLSDGNATSLQQQAQSSLSLLNIMMPKLNCIVSSCIMWFTTLWWQILAAGLPIFFTQLTYDKLPFSPHSITLCLINASSSLLKGPFFIMQAQVGQKRANTPIPPVSFIFPLHKRDLPHQ